MKPLILALLSTLALALPLAAAPLEIVDVSAPAINCIFDSDCTITVNDTTAPISLPAASGEGFLQSRTAPPGEPGTVGQGFVPYEYRIDLRQVVGVLALPCITQLVVELGALQPLDYDGDGHAEDVYVVTGGGLGSVGLASADQVGDQITFRFDPAVCAGSHPGGGESTFFFGLAGTGPPQPVSAQATVSLGGVLTLAARAPGGAGPGGPGGGPGPGVVPALCLPGLPISADVPVCRCLRDRVLRELRCGVLGHDFVLVRRTPLPIPPGRPFEVRWSFAPLGGFAGKVIVEDGIAPGFAPAVGSQRLVFEGQEGQGTTVTHSYRLRAATGEKTLSVPSLVTVKADRGRNEPESFQLLLPLGPAPSPGLDDAPTEPIPRPPADPDFGPGPCGRAAQRLWDEHVERFGSTPFGLSYAEYTDLRTRAERCRRALPSFGGLCGSAGQAAWAGCFLRRGRDCRTEGQAAVERCVRFGLGEPLDGILGGFRDDLIDLGGP